MSRAGPSHTYRSASGIGVVASLDGRPVLGTIDVDDANDAGQLVAAAGPDGVVAPAQPTTTKSIAPMDAVDRVIG